jgi:hypothetical protein
MSNIITALNPYWSLLKKYHGLMRPLQSAFIDYTMKDFLEAEPSECVRNRLGPYIQSERIKNDWYKLERYEKHNPSKS